MPPCPDEVDGPPGLNKTPDPSPRPCRPDEPPGQAQAGGTDDLAGGSSDQAGGGDKGHGSSDQAGGGDKGHGSSDQAGGGDKGHGNPKGGLVVTLLPLASAIALSTRVLRRRRRSP